METVCRFLPGTSAVELIVFIFGLVSSIFSFLCQSYVKTKWLFFRVRAALFSLTVQAEVAWRLVVKRNCSTEGKWTRSFLRPLASLRIFFLFLLCLTLGLTPRVWVRSEVELGVCIYSMFPNGTTGLKTTATVVWPTPGDWVFQEHKPEITCFLIPLLASNT